MKIYSITKGQLWVVRVFLILILLFLFFNYLTPADDPTGFYFLLFLITFGFLIFYEIGWRNFNKKTYPQKAGLLPLKGLIIIIIVIGIAMVLISLDPKSQEKGFDFEKGKVIFDPTKYGLKKVDSDGNPINEIKYPK